MFYYSVSLTCIFLASIVANLLVTRIVAGQNLKYASLRQETLGELTGIVEEYYRQSL